MPSSTFPFAVAPHFTELEQRWREIPAEYEGNALSMLRLLETARAVGGGVPMIVTSWYRTPARNTAVGGSETSQHLTASAVDFVPGIDAREWLDRVASILAPSQYGQLIFYAATSGHIHLSLPNRASGKTGEVLLETSPGRYRALTDTNTNATTTTTDGAEGIARGIVQFGIVALIALIAVYLLGTL